MTFPLTVGPGQTGYLANPDTSKYFFWQGKATSAHYYVNNAGVSEAEGCTWSKPEYGHGNWAPLIFGTSFDDINMHQGFSSIKQNELNKGADLNYSVTFKGDGVNSPCSYNAKTHQYCMDGRCWTDKSIGCTVSLLLRFIAPMLTFIGLCQPRPHSHPRSLQLGLARQC
jgi:hypothetical protein